MSTWYQIALRIKPTSVRHKPAAQNICAGPGPLSPHIPEVIDHWCDGSKLSSRDLALHHHKFISLFLVVRTQLTCQGAKGAAFWRSFTTVVFQLWQCWAVSSCCTWALRLQLLLQPHLLGFDPNAWARCTPVRCRWRSGLMKQCCIDMMRLLPDSSPADCCSGRSS